MKIKRVFAAILAALTISAAAVSLTACGGNNEGAGSAASTVTSSVESAVSSAASAASSEASAIFNSTSSAASSIIGGASSSEASSSVISSSSSASSSIITSSAPSTTAGKYNSIDEYINLPAFQSQLNSLKKSSSSLMDIDIRAEGNALVYEYKYTSNQTSAVADALKSQLAGQNITNVFNNVVKELENKTTVSDPYVIVRYLNSDGSLLAEKTFKGTGSAATSSAPSSSSSSSTPSSSSSAASSSAVSSTTPSTGSYVWNTASDFVNASATQQQIKQVKSQLRSQGLDADFIAEGNNVVVVYQYMQQQTLTDSAKSMMGSYIDQQAPSMKNALKTGIKSNPGLVFRILNKDGSVVLEKSY